MALLLLLTKYVLRMRPMGNFGAKTIIQHAEDTKWEEMNPNYLKDMISNNVAAGGLWLGAVSACDGPELTGSSWQPYL